MRRLHKVNNIRDMGQAWSARKALNKDSWIKGDRMSTPITITRVRLDKQRRFRLPAKLHEECKPGEYDLREIKNEEGKMLVIQELKT